jgi:DNA polymerase-2
MLDMQPAPPLIERTGWLLDLYDCPERARRSHPRRGQEESASQGGVILWLLGDDGVRYRLHQPFPITFYAAGPAVRLRVLWRYLQNQPLPVDLERAQRRDLFSQQPLTVLAIQVKQAAVQAHLFQQVVQRFPDLSFYDADIPLSLRYAARYGVFPLARCRVLIDDNHRLHRINPLDSPWDLDPPALPLRLLSLDPNCDPSQTTPSHLDIHFERHHYRLSLKPQRPFLVGLGAILRRHDPDVLLTSWGDTWLLPHLLSLSRRARIPLPLNREPHRGVSHRPARTYFSYGQVIYRGRQVHLFGRWHIDRYNAMLFHDYGIEGSLEMARITSLPVQTAARVSPGTGISSMQMLTALRSEILVPWHKQQAEHLKSALDLLHADQGGLVYQPTIGLHQNVAEIDFISMYPSIMVHFNISPETVGSSRNIAQAAPQLGSPGDPDEPPGLVPQTLAPLLNKRLALKNRLAELPRWHPDYRTYQARASAHKWLLVTCFGYLGYKNARFGRIEAHEAVTAYGREALLRAKEAAEDLGYSVLHLYVDGLWVSKPGAAKVADFQPLLEEIIGRTGLPIALDGVYRWVAFLPSRQDQRVPVANRYFGVFQDGSLKIRGIEARRRDTPPFIAQTQLEMLQILAQALSPNPADLPLSQVLALLRRQLAALRAGRVPLKDLLVSQKLSRTLDEYRTPSPVARAVAQLAAVGKQASPGQRIRFLYTRGEPGVYAWNLPQPPNPASVDVNRYSELLLRAASAVLQPFMVSEVRLRHWLFSNAAYSAPPGVVPPRAFALELRTPVALPLWLPERAPAELS